MAKTKKKLPLSLLYVEDKASLRKQYTPLLKEIVEDLRVAENGKEGLKQSY